MPEYRWGIFPAPPVSDKKIGFEISRARRCGAKFPVSYGTSAAS
jgi:hypothetical protein